MFSRSYLHSWLPAGAFLKASTNICSSETWRQEQRLPKNFMSVMGEQGKLDMTSS